MVLKIFAALAGLVKVRLVHIFVDSHVFRLHYRWTTSLCFIACALVAATEYIGDPIQCMDGTDSVEKAINTYCWIASTYTINSTSKTGAIPGLGNEVKGRHERTYRAYYQWVPFILFFQGCLFYLPHLLWKSKEHKTAETLLQGLNVNSLDTDIEKKKSNIIKFLKASKGRNVQYSVVYFICEALNFLNVIGQIFLLDAFFSGSFMRYGIEALAYVIDEDAGDTFVTPFPKITKCTFVKYGPSGTPIIQQPLCILPQNILNEKIFVIMWFWFVILASITAMQLVWHLVVCFTPVIRIRLLERRGKMDASAELEKSIQRLHLGDFFLLNILGRNLDALTFKDILMGAVVDKDANDNRDAYKPLGIGEDDDDDPISMKRKMEIEEASV